MENQSLVSIKDLKKGDLVKFYGQIFKCTSDPKIYKTEYNYSTGKEETKKPKFWVYRVDCKIVNKDIARSNVSDILINYDGFQGNESVKHIKIN